MADAYKEMHLKDVLEPFDALMRPEVLRGLLLGEDATEEERARMLKALDAFVTAAMLRLGRTKEPGAADAGLLGQHAPPDVAAGLPVNEEFAVPFSAREGFTHARLIAAILSVLGDGPSATRGIKAAGVARDWLLPKHLIAGLRAYGKEEQQAVDCAHLVLFLLEGPGLLGQLESEVWGPVLHRLLDSAEARAFLRVHHYGANRWLNKEQLELFCACNLASCARELMAPELAGMRDTCRVILDAAADCSYDFDSTLAVLK